ncbi:MAG: 30S ribosomal protein S20 [Candidatus Marinimicrobia bacterium]|nr:30S ribosomal protein S20 [Candidatus Neomarinimicrobiota bacterium]MBS00677.1 30S ribosomal protein S20 [Candidatus Neomarinimicrobiota bacterium]MEC7935318.1 30S ribosomal protein S20 [Candidatus Neomarinimicrobiota bacterium]MEC9106564.1 30S ribosomal protein S20 [Candidatus Neomarinimicrobiota bacterium]MED5256030.1 30S ribosomal protein S20 [Candidatus Neomarinimicrobiota bacterium]|tara:strand:+ start:4829 stop:5086 length:258 start_codon:yes stop_codon:yes gene_type:complete
MDRHPQQIKRERQDKKRRLKNISQMSELKTSIKKVLSMSDQKDAENLYRDTVKLIDKAASKGLIKKNTASRRKSRITRHLNSISK